MFDYKISEIESRYDRHIAQRFVNDMNLPIQVIDEKTFHYWLKEYQDDYDACKLWNELWAEIDNRFSGDASKFLEDYYQVRDNIIKTVTESEAFKKFNNSIMPVPEIQMSPRNKELYGELNVGKTYISFDLVKSNIQALNYADPNILLNSKTYEEFISKFTESKYIAKSKYFRQVVFGQMNPKRHITLAKYLISKVYEVARRFGLDYELVCVSSDEIVFEVPEGTTKDFMRHVAVTIPVLAEKELGLEVRGTYFTLEAYVLKTDNCSKVTTFYIKRGGNVGMKLKSVPLPYASIIHKLLNGETPNEYDMLFQYDNKCTGRFVEVFHIEKLSQD